MSSETPDAGEPGMGVRGVARALAERALGAGTVAQARTASRLVTRKELAEPLPLAHKLRAWRLGFRAENAALYGLANCASGLYISDDTRARHFPGLNLLPRLFDHKLLLRQFLAEFDFAQPETVAMVSRHGVLLDPLGAAPRYASAAELAERMVRSGDRYIWKPESGQRGAGIALLHVEGGQLVARRGTTSRPFTVPARTGSPMLVERVVAQHAYWAALSPTSLNSLRILTCWTPGDAAPFIARAVQRMGTSRTTPTDNWSGGGLCALVDLGTGRLGAGRVNPFKSGMEDREYATHPETGAPIAGAVLPLWHEIAETALAAARRLPYETYIGWDIAVGVDGRPVIIEGNKNSDLNLLQVHGGLLAEPAMRRYLERCRVL